MRFRGICYRALNPVWVGDPLSGEGARRHGGRYNARGVPALYTTLDPVTALREVSQIGQPLQPTILVSFRADLGPVFDATDPAQMAAQGVDPALLVADDWRLFMARGQDAPSQNLARRLQDAGFAGMIAHSHARLAPPQARNLILWSWQPGLTLIDDEARLGPA